MASFTPEVFGKYYLVDKIATGGMAEIFKAKTYSHGGFENILVIKRILSHLGENEEFVEMFVDEAKVSVALQHANIIRIYDFGKILDNYFIAMEWVDGKDVRNLLKKLANERRFLPVEYAVYIAHEACRGLDYAHRKTTLQGRPYGIVHRDVSPSNLLISYEGDVKIADFGIAKAESNASHTKDGVLKGKFEYMSPEQAEGKEIDHRSDLFSLGIILHEMLTGRRLFKAGSELQTLEAIKKCDVPPPTLLHARVPVALDHIVMKALSRDPAERYQSAKDMQDDLAGFLAPSTPDQIRQRLAALMSEVFDRDINDERQRLDEGSQVAEQLRRKNTFEEGWEGRTNSTVTGTHRTAETATRPGSGRPYAWAAFLVVAFLAVVMVAIGAGVGLKVLADASQGGQAETARPAIPAVGSLDVLLLPGGAITVDGRHVGDGEVTLTGLSPGNHQIRVELADHQTLEETVQVRAGEVTRFKRTLAAVAAREPERTPERNREVRSASAPEARGDTGPPASSEPAAPGKISVAVVGGGWATVLVDGVQQTKAAPTTLSVPPGRHTVQVQNAELGIHHIESIEVTSGGTVKVLARAQ